MNSQPTTATAPAATTPAHAATPGATSTPSRYLAPGRGTAASNAVMAWLSRRGLSVRGSRVLAVRGRTSGEWRTTPVNPLTFEGERYLVAPRGVTQWVRNLRATDGGELRIGKRTEPFTYVELTDAEKPAVLREYLHKWKFEVGTFFDGVGPDATDADLLAIAPGYPVFRITPTA